jgi:hypothetical protein
MPRNNLIVNYLPPSYKDLDLRVKPTFSSPFPLHPFTPSDSLLLTSSSHFLLLFFFF